MVTACTQLIKSAPRAERHSALALFVSRVFTDNPHDAFTLDNFAVSADLSDRASDFHAFLRFEFCLARHTAAPVALQVRFFQQPFVLMRQQMTLDLGHEVHDHHHHDKQ